MNRTHRRILSAVAAFALIAAGAVAVRQASRSEASYAQLHARAQAVVAGEFLHHGGHGHAGARMLLGTREAAGIAIAATQVGTLDGAAMATFEFQADRSAPGVELRAWIGPREGSRVVAPAALGLAADSVHAHLELPIVVGPEAKLWVEVSAPGRTPEVVGFDLAR